MFFGGGAENCLGKRPRVCMLGLAFLVMLATLSGCRKSAAIGEDKPQLTLTSTGVQNGQILKNFTCDGANISPELAWSVPPAGTQSFALTVIDIDAPMGEFVHWVLYNLPASKRELPEGLSPQAQLPDGARQTQTDFDKPGYGGPCPPGKSAHRYVFTIYALDTTLNLPADATRKQVEDALKPHVLARGALTGKYGREK